MKKLYQIHPADNVAVDLETGFKEALRDIPAGEAVIKYGNPIGHAAQDIHAGERVHTENMATSLREHEEYEFHGIFRSAGKRTDEPADGSADVSETAPERTASRTFQGYLRSDGRAGTRNELFIIPTVGCVNSAAERLAALCSFSDPETGQTKHPIALTHPYGCSQLGDDLRVTQQILSGLALNPNAGGVLVLALGCENNTLESFRPQLRDADPERIRFLVCQDAEDEIAEGKRLISELLLKMSGDRRVPCPLSALTIGLKCGGSDGFSGITANPLLGRFTDAFTACGGTAILTEVPEMFGAERLLMDRAASREVFDDTVDLINRYKDYFVRHGQTVYENPSPGNIAGGITTLEDKSLGCTQKSGSGPVMGVLGYGDRIGREGFRDSSGLYLLEGPGNDMVAVTNLAAAGCGLILFTTGRGTPLGSPVPVVKVSSNAALALKKRNWIDFDASGALDDTGGCDSSFFSSVLAFAEGRETANERNASHDIAIFKDGVTL